MPPQQVVWDPVKARRNKKKHGVDFEEAATVFRDQLLLILPDPAHSGEENRWVALEKSVSQLLLVVVHTEDERRVRIISARKAEPRERGNMNRNSKRPRKNNEVQPEYDFGRALRGKYLKRFPQDVVMVTLAPDVAAVREVHDATQLDRFIPRFAARLGFLCHPLRPAVVRELFLRQLRERLAHALAAVPQAIGATRRNQHNAPCILLDIHAILESLWQCDPGVCCAGRLVRLGVLSFSYRPSAAAHSVG